jgi:hypothetical protein
MDPEGMSVKEEVIGASFPPTLALDLVWYAM